VPPKPKLATLARRRKYTRDRNGRFATTGSAGPSLGALAAGRHRASPKPKEKAPPQSQARAAERRLRAVFGDRLHVQDQNHPAVRQHLVDLDGLPEQHKRRLAHWFAESDGGGIWIADRPHVLDAVGREDMRRKFAGGPADIAAGMYFNVERVLSLTTQQARSESPARHEAGHAFDDSLHWASVNPRYPFRAAAARAARRGQLLPYFSQQPADDRNRGLRETFAESYALWTIHRNAPDRALRIATGLGAPTETAKQRAAAHDLGRDIGDWFDTLA
jgi:hypothetical protein